MLTSKDWYRIFQISLLAALIAIAVAAWPTAMCALGQCGDKDLWCNGNCSQTCQPATSLGIVANSSGYPSSGFPACRPNVSGGYCIENWQPDQCAVRCSDSGTCNVTELVSGGNCSGRLSSAGGYSYWIAGSCSYSAGTCTYISGGNRDRVDCCTLGNSGGGGGGCTPTYASPTVSLGATSPRNPLVYGQDPDKLGTTVTVSASGGAKTNSCSDGPAQRSVTSISMGGVALSEASIDWILDILSLRYPGAYIKDSYPLFPTLIPSGIGTTTAGATFHYNPLDPGIYNVTITAIQDDGQTTTTVLNVPAYLLDATITLPVQP